MDEEKNILLEKSFDFVLAIVELYKVLSKDKKEFVLSKQLLRSGTSVRANIREAQSKVDFIHKLAISQKECDESCYWLELMVKSRYLEEGRFNYLHQQATSIRSSILTTINK